MTNKEIYLRLLGYSRPYLWRIVLSIIFSLIVAGTDVGYVNLIEPLVDKVITAGNHELVYLVPVVIIGLAILKGAGRYFQEYYIKTAGQLVVQDLRNGLFKKFMHLSMGFHVNQSSGGLTSKVLNDVGVMQKSAADALVDGVRESFTLVGLVCLAFYKDWRLSAVAFTVLPFCVIPASVLGRRIKTNIKLSLESVGFLTVTLQESFDGIKVIKAFGREENQIHKFKNANKAYYRVVAVDDQENRSGDSEYVEATRPFIYSAPVTNAPADQPYRYQVKAIRSLGDLTRRDGAKPKPGTKFWKVEPLKFSLTQRPDWMSINADTGLITGTSDGTGGTVQCN